MPFESFESVEPFVALSGLSVLKPVFLRRSSLKKGIAASQDLQNYPIFLSSPVTSKRTKAFIEIQRFCWFFVPDNGGFAEFTAVNGARGSWKQGIAYPSTKAYQR